MGDRISISFKNGDEESVALFSHWGGQEFLKVANGYVEQLVSERKGHRYPLDRFEPSVVMVDFIRHLTKDEERVVSDYRLEKTPEDGDNSDNGHFTIRLDTPEIKVFRQL